MLCVISGGNWNNGSNAGVWITNLNNFRTNSNNNVGLRSDCMPRMPQGKGGVEGDTFLPQAKSLCNALSGRPAVKRFERQCGSLL